MTGRTRGPASAAALHALRVGVLVAIVVLTAVAIAFGIDIRTVGDMGELPSTLPQFLIPDVPFTLETLQISFPIR